MVKEGDAPPVEDEHECDNCREAAHEGEECLFAVVGHLNRITVAIT